MMGLFRAWRERGWVEIDAPAYARAWQTWGGSVATHPEIVARLSDLVGLPVRYLGWPASGGLQMAVACWDGHVALSRDVLKRKGKRDYFDLGNAEIILPAQENAQAPLRQKARYLSSLSAAHVSTARQQKECLAIARAPEALSRKFRYNQRRELRLLEEAGGQVRPVSDFTPAELAAFYADLFERRWAFEVPAKAHLADVFSLLREFMMGSVIFLDDAPAAIQVLYRVESPRWISVEYVNGGVAPESRDFSPGSVLSFLNTQAAWEEARALGKDLRFSFGRADREYKDRWCNRVPVHEVK
ncbi:GNAT family N-acetyltransferase [Pseudomonas sp. LTJR-52]|uniref:GNAT family N-acetyltransferase n=1 Tax=Pseudomonas sp. LTJR-52 TaxID=2479392 RepID=UPI000EFBE522|nr:GNAT family N-acetyltransferase [Pseudomonas sp. LTJR-52]AYN95729.1 GNAT family N-acetyltransferase [Pseudomonas sp. LTJR-52]